jgi:uncharacterized protein (TIGR00725 family)
VCTESQRDAAFRIGSLLADAGAVVICGGGTGVMEAVAAGARQSNGLVIGVRPGPDDSGASPDLSATLVTNMGEARNAIIVWSADAVIAVGGSWGTLSEVALARRRGDEIPVIVLDGWRISDAHGTAVPGLQHVDSAEDAVRHALSAIAGSTFQDRV